MACRTVVGGWLSDAGHGGKLCSVFSKERFRNGCRRTEEEKRLGQRLWKGNLEGLDKGVHGRQEMYGEILGGAESGRKPIISAKLWRCKLKLQMRAST